MAEVSPIGKPQPQIAQLECLFAGPLVKGSMVEYVNDLISLNPIYNYNHRQVWVKSEKANYYLASGDGTELINWEKSSARVVIKRYDPNQTYPEGESVYLSGKIYSAKQSVPKLYNPLDYEAYWLIISGETETKRFLFSNTNSVILYTEIRNPRFEVILGDIITDINGIPQLDPVTGLAVYSGKEIVEAFIEQREDLPNNNGVPYEISFFENDNNLSMFSGYINVK